MSFSVDLVEKQRAIPGLPGGSINYQGHLFSQKGHLCWENFQTPERVFLSSGSAHPLCELPSHPPKALKEERFFDGVQHTPRRAEGKTAIGVGVGGGGFVGPSTT